MALVDLTGIGRGERGVVQRALAALRSLLGVMVRAAVADGPYVAALAARRTPDEVTIVPRDRGAAYLAPLLVGVLPLPKEAVMDLTRLGVRNVREFVGLRYSQVQERYGALGLAAFALAIGTDNRPLIPRMRERHETLTWPCEPPVDDLAPVLFITKALLDNHAATLRREGLVASGLRLTLCIECHDPVVIEQRWGAACVPGAAELDALRLAVSERFVPEGDDATLPPRVTEIAVALLECALDEGAQLPLFGADVIVQREAVGHWLTRMHALLGPLGVVEDVPLPAHAPEERWQSRPYDAGRIGAPVAPTFADGVSLPSLPGMERCRPPEPVVLGWVGERVARFRAGDAQRDVIAALGPYHFEGNWWGEHPFDRAYWFLLSADQALHLMVEDRATGAWSRVGVVS